MNCSFAFIRVTLASAMTLSLTLLGNVPSQAAFILVDDFDTYTTSSAINGQGSWTSDNTANTVEADPDNGSNNVLSIGVADNTDTFNTGINLPNNTTGTLFARFYMSGNTTNANIGLSDIASPTAFGDFEVQNRLASGVLDARDAGSFVSLTSGSNSADDTGIWYNIWMVANNTSDTVQTYIQSDDDPNFLTQTALNVPDATQNFRNGTASALQTLFIRTGLPDTHGVLFDDFYFDASGQNLADPLTAPVPEPASLSLWLLLGLGSIVRSYRCQRRQALVR